MTKSTTDIFMSIKPEHIKNIVSGSKNHEYRSYLLPPSIQHIWFYITSPIKEIEYAARISPGKIPGEVPDNGGIGNAEFNAGLKKPKYGYEILALWRLKKAVSLEMAIVEGFLKGAPQIYCWVSSEFLERVMLDGRDLVLERMDGMSVEYRDPFNLDSAG